jgi:hypothetical protein
VWLSNDLRERIQSAFYDREKRELRPLVWGLVGLILAVVGLSIFAMDVAMAFEGHSTVVVNRRRGTTMAVQVRALLMLFFGTSGVITIHNAIRLGCPAVYESRAYRWLSRPILITLVLATFALGAFVVYVHYVR